MKSSSVMIEVKDLNKNYGNFQVLKNISVTIHRGEVVAILGPSGSGKSTFLRTLNHLEPIQTGKIQVQSQTGMVFQGFHLFPHLTIWENIALAPRVVAGWSVQKQTQVGQELLNRVGILDQAQKYPSQLSGGQQQRAAIARALEMQPQIILLDEPTSSLDPEMTAEVLDVIRELAHSGMTLLVVTHELDFAQEVSNRVLFFDSGEMIEDAPSESFFRNPQHPRSQSFLKKFKTSHHRT